MKTLTFLFICFTVFATVAIYFLIIQYEPVIRQDDVVKPQVSNTETQISSTDTKHEDVLLEQKTIHTDVKQDDTDIKQDDTVSDWRDDNQTIQSKKKRSDPFTDYLQQINTKEDGTFIDDPETMDPDEFRSALERQLIQKFGDIPAVHAYMDYHTKWDNNTKMTLAEEVEGLKATMELFPSVSIWKTIVYNEWLLSKGARTDADLNDLTPEDIAYLRSEGISVTTKEKRNGDFVITISTK